MSLSLIHISFSISEDDWLNQHMVEAYKDQYDPADGPVRENSEYINYYGVVAVNQQGTSMAVSYTHLPQGIP